MLTATSATPIPLSSPSLDRHEEVKQEILTRYGVVASESFDAVSACDQRVAYLKQFLRTTGRRGIVLGISGGVDSSTAGRLSQLACEQLRSEGYDAKFYAVRLPAGVQRDEEDAQAALAFINPDHVLTINVGAAADLLNLECLRALEQNGVDLTPQWADYHKGNIKARLRMTAQYHLAGAYGAVVLGTDHNSECVAGFFTKHGDGAADLVVLNGLNKRQVRRCAEHLGAPVALWAKAPTADLEELNPGKLDDEGFGFPYAALDDFLEGKVIDPAIEAKIVALYVATNHKRAPIVAFEG